MSRTEVWDSGDKNGAPLAVYRFKLFRENDPYRIPENNTFTNDISFWEQTGSGYPTYRKYEYYGEVLGRTGNDTIIGSTDIDVTSNNEKYSDTIEAQPETLKGFAGDDYINGRDGDDYIDGGPDNDVLIGGGGTDNILGYGGNDVIVSAIGVDETDIVTGGEGIDTFILREELDGGTTINGNYDWTKLAFSLAGDVSDFIFTASGVGFAGKLVKEVVPAAIDIIKYFVNGPSEDLELEGDTPSNPSYIKVTDFNLTEDMVIIPISDNDLADIRFAVEVWGTETGIAVYRDNSDNGTDMVAFLNLEDIPVTNDNTDAHQDLLQQIRQSALIIDNGVTSSFNGVFEFKSENGVNLKNNDGKEVTTDLETNENYIILGAVGPQTLWTYNDENLYGTKNYGDYLYAYTPFEYFESTAEEDDTESEIQSEYQDSLVGVTFGNTLFGRGGNDFLFSGAGNDRLDGGDDNDTAVYMESPGGIKAELSNNKVIDGFTTVVNEEEGLFQTYTDTLIDIENIVGSEHDDSIIGDDNANALFGLAGDDTIKGEGDADTIDGGNDADLIYGGGGNDSLIGGVDYKPIDGNDTIYGEEGNDYIHGGDMDDYLDGGDGDDEIYGGSNADTLIGGKHNDTLFGNWGSDLLKGGMGTDVIYGGQNNDTIYGEMGTDDIYGNEGNDILNGGKGYDTMTGGAGADTFILGGNSKKDIITDFDSTEGDTIDIDKSIYGFSTVSDLSFNSTTGELTVSTAVEPIAILENPVNFVIENDISLF